MLDPKFIREDPDAVRRSLEIRGDDVSLVDEFLSLDEARRNKIQEVEELKSEKNRASKSIGELIKKGENAEAAKEEVKKLNEKINELDRELKEIEAGFGGLLDTIPNIPHESVPVGKDETDNRLEKEEGSIPSFSFKPRDHIELGQITRTLDLERGAKIAGSGFPLFTGAGAKLERALINFMLDVHIREHGYTEVFPPIIVNRNAMRGTGQLPKFEEDLYKIKDEEFFLIPTAEVPVTNIHMDEVLKEEDLPLYYTAYTACFRKEAGSYGKDTRGIIRVHQFDKVEMVKFTTPESSMEELEKLLGDAEDILQRLEVPYRVLTLCSGDISFAAHKCYDIEVWAPGLDKWLEVSSCSVFSDFQARRANIKYQPKDRNEKARFVHTLNGSGVALPRLVIAVMENHQNEDGSIKVPEALRPYFGSDTIGTE
ncbi:MAG: serine--tRNA ligase [Candidatus Omnitrophica bacterium]|nr:serine--tRNA ligase [Candidatus Omnitrophota bacterium]